MGLDCSCEKREADAAPPQSNATNQDEWLAEMKDVLNVTNEGFHIGKRVNVDKMFSKYDTNGDDVISREEAEHLFNDICGAMAGAFTYGIEQIDAMLAQKLAQSPAHDYDRLKAGNRLIKAGLETGVKLCDGMQKDPGFFAQSFATTDTDRDGKISKTEFKAMCEDTCASFHFIQGNVSWRFE